MMIRCGEPEFPVPESSQVDADFSVTFAPDDFAPSTVTFTSTTSIAEGVTDITYTWNMGDGTIESGNVVEHNYENPGDYEVSLVVKSEDDLDAITKTITVRDPNALSVEILFMDGGSQTINNLNGTSFSVDGFGTGLAYDKDREILYWTDEDNGSFNSSDVDGANAATLVTGLTEPRDIALDIVNNLAYIADRGTNEIIAVDLSDNSTSVLYDNTSDGLGADPVGIDYYNGNVYVTCVAIDSESVWVGNVDGSGISNIIDFNAGGFGYGIAVDLANEKIYFDDSESGFILMANLDGSDIEQVIATANRVYGIAVDNTNSKLYWGERNTGNIYASDLDGSNRQTVGSGFTDPRGLIFIE